MSENNEVLLPPAPPAPLNNDELQHESINGNENDERNDQELNDTMLIAPLDPIPLTNMDMNSDANELKHEVLTVEANKTSDSSNEVPKSMNKTESIHNEKAATIEMSKIDDIESDKMETNDDNDENYDEDNTENDDDSDDESDTGSNNGETSSVDNRFYGNREFETALEDRLKNIIEKSKKKWKVIPPEWRPTKKKDRGQLLIGEYRDKMKKKLHLKQIELKTGKINLRQWRLQQIRQYGRFKCKIPQCRYRFYTKTEKIAHEEEHSRKLDHYYQRQMVSELIWNCKVVRPFKQEMNYKIIQLIVDYADPDGIYYEKRPKIRENPSCTCLCVCGFERYEDQKRIIRGNFGFLKSEKKRMEVERMIENKYVIGKGMEMIDVVKITDEIDYKFNGPNTMNSDIEYRMMMDPLVSKCICECYCGSKAFNISNFKENISRFVDSSGINAVFQHNVKPFFDQYAGRFRPQTLPDYIIKTPNEYTKSCWFLIEKRQVDMFLFQNYPIVSTLTKINRDDCKDDNEYNFLKNEGIAIFKDICCLMGVCKYRDPKNIGYEIVSKGIKYGQLRDEIYMQIIKQTTRLPNIKAGIAAWKLLYLCLSGFPPSQEMSTVILSHICQHARTDGIGSFDNIPNIARHCFYAWINCMSGVVQQIDIKDTWKLMKKHKLEWLKLNIYTYDGSKMTIHVPMNMTVGDIVNIALDYFGLSKYKNTGEWCLKGYTNDVSINAKLLFTTPNVSIVHLTSRWHAELTKNSEKDLTVKFVLWKKIWNDNDLKLDTYNERGYNMLINNQLIRDFDDGLFQPDLDLSLQIISLKISMFKLAKSLNISEKNYTWISQFIPKWIRNKRIISKKDWLYSILQTVNALEYTNKKVTNKNEYDNYLKHIWLLQKILIKSFMKSQMFGCSFFVVNSIYINDSIKEINKMNDCLLRINSSIISFSDTELNTIHYEFLIDNLMDVEFIKVNNSNALKLKLNEFNIIILTDETLAIAKVIANSNKPLFGTGFVKH